MIAVARRVGGTLRDDFFKTQRPEAQEVERRAAEALYQQLSRLAPDIGHVIEGLDDREGSDGSRRWIVDPLDGTANFARGMGHWAVSIALVHNGAVTSAVVYDPLKDEVFSASLGQGAWLNERTRLTCSARGELSQAMLATGMPPGRSTHLDSALGQFGTLLRSCSGVRQWGAAALDLAYVAAGRLDGYWNRRLHPWHYAAGALLVLEAGGAVQPLHPARDTNEGDLVGIASDLFQAFDAALRNENSLSQ